MDRTSPTTTKIHQEGEVDVDNAQRYGPEHYFISAARVIRCTEATIVAKKKEKYFSGGSGTSPFAITTEVLAKTEWKPTDFQERQQRFLKPTETRVEPGLIN